MKRGRSRIDDSAYPLFITATITDFVHVFDESAIAEASLKLMEERRRTHDMRIYGYVLMPNHFHAIVQAHRQGETSNFMASWKSLSARMILERISADLPTAFSRAARRFSLPNRKEHQVWMPRFDDLALYEPATFAVKLKYIHENPVRAGIASKPEDYQFSSAAFYDLNQQDEIITLSDCRPLIAGYTA